MPSSAPQHTRHRGRAAGRTARAVALTLVAIAAFSAAAAAAIYRDLQTNITDAGDVTALLGDRPPDAPSMRASAPSDRLQGAPVNVLILGSDDRSGANADIGGANDGMNSDTTIVAHISADRTRVELVSIPRDLIVDRPACTTKDGTTIPAKPDSQFNEAFAVGWNHSEDLATAAACTWTTVESITHVRLDGFLLLDFVGFQSMVDAIGGVPICLPQAYADTETGLDVPAGQQVFDGTTALQFARARHHIGDGSDTQRIVRQHALMAAMSRQLLSSDVLTDPVALFSFARAATSSLTASDRFASLTDLTGLGLSVRHLTADRIVFLSMPTGTSPTNHNRVVWADAATTLWARIAADQPVGEAPPAGPVTPVTPTSPAPDPVWTPPGGMLTAADDSSTCA